MCSRSVFSHYLRAGVDYIFFPNHFSKESHYIKDLSDKFAYPLYNTSLISRYVPLGSGILVLRINLGSSQFHPVRCVGQYRSMMAVSFSRANLRNTNSWPTVSDHTICPAKAFGRFLVFWKLCHRTTDPLKMIRCYYNNIIKKYIII